MNQHIKRRGHFVLEVLYHDFLTAYRSFCILIENVYTHFPGGFDDNAGVPLTPSHAIGETNIIRLLPSLMLDA
jgi:hypothetical protein